MSVPHVEFIVHQLTPEHRGVMEQTEHKPPADAAMTLGCKVHRKTRGTHRYHGTWLYLREEDDLLEAVTLLVNDVLDKLYHGRLLHEGVVHEPTTLEELRARR